VERGYKFRAYPNAKQQNLIEQTFDAKRYVWNELLATQAIAYSVGHKKISAYDWCHDVVILKKNKSWLKVPDKWALTTACEDLEDAFRKFFKGAGYPKFKKKYGEQSYKSTNSNNSIEFKDSKIKLPKVGWIKVRGYDSIKGRISSAIVRRDSCGDYYISLCCVDIEKPKFARTDKAVGIDLGIKDRATTSDGIKFKNNKRLAKEEKQLKLLQHRLSKKTKGSKNREKARKRLAKLERKISRQRKDDIH